ncbi:LysE family transporter (plasmid) [Legionella adelaidensis]|uniref:LysE family transporter n=1 Tax=Legionella adelaidensis TaxID=45056 RepID=A0A0W0R0N6_9GAMM|nr:LysE family transporter [Legionella adelaidensis]KTC64626.1 LysE family transporter [Legionella adelaidensis]VEH86094.1 LysE family transporter [Legionella adelaidensis]
MPIYLNGLMLGLSLIMALGPQNVFLIRQGALRKHAVLSALTCFFCDSLLITGSVAGLHHLLETHDSIRLIMICFGSLFLAYYGFITLKQCFTKKSAPVQAEQNLTTRWQIILLALSFSLLNPHAIIDSLVIIGGGSIQFPGHQKEFLFGVLTSSLVWFSALTFSTYYFSKALTKATIWRRVEFCSGILMLFLSVKLLCSF